MCRLPLQLQATFSMTNIYRKNRFVRYRRRGQKSVLKSLSDERAFLSCAALRMLVKICLTKQEKRKSYQMMNMQKVLVSDNDLILLWFSPPGKPYLRQPFEVTFNRLLKVEWNLLICIFGRKTIAKGNKTDIGNSLNTSRKTTYRSEKIFCCRLHVLCVG